MKSGPEEVAALPEEAVTTSYRPQRRTSLTELRAGRHSKGKIPDKIKGNLLLPHLEAVVANKIIGIFLFKSLKEQPL